MNRWYLDKLLLANISVGIDSRLVSKFGRVCKKEKLLIIYGCAQVSVLVNLHGIADT